MDHKRRIRLTRALQAAIGFSTLLWTGDALANSAIVSAITSACAGKTMTVNVSDCALCHGSAFTTVNSSNMYWSDAQSGFYDTFCTASATGSTGTGTGGGTSAGTGTGTGTTAGTGGGTGSTAGSVFDAEDEVDRRFSHSTHAGSGRGGDGVTEAEASAGDGSGSAGATPSATGGSRRDAKGGNGQGTERRSHSRHWGD